MNAYFAANQYAEGYEAFRSGRTRKHNPYVPGTTDAYIWLEGFLDARDDEESKEKK